MEREFINFTEIGGEIHNLFRNMGEYTICIIGLEMDAPVHNNM